MIRLKQLRQERNLFQKDIAEYLNITQGTYSIWENGKGEIDFKNLKKLATFYNVDINYILGFEPTLEAESIFKDVLELMNKLDMNPDIFKKMTPEQLDYAKALIKTIQDQNKKG